jgi:hypothetical protein
MDISKYIAELLFEHDCVIIPGFGGFVCNYKAAEIDPVQNTIAPPCKAISFNKNLRTNDGLLLNYIANRENTSFDEAFVSVYAWVSSSKGLLERSEEVRINKVGILNNNIEDNLQFTPDESVNYLKSSFGLQTLTALPVIRKKAAKPAVENKPVVKEMKPVPTNYWRIAATLFLLAAMASVIQLMRSGIEIKPLHLEEASVMNTVSRLFGTSEPELKPVAVEVISPAVSIEKEEPTTEVAIENTIPQVTKEPSTAYYIVVGAFAEQKNITSATEQLKEKHPGAEILVEKGAHLTKVGFSAGNNLYEATALLRTAQKEDETYWLLKK